MSNSISQELSNFLDLVKSRTHYHAGYPFNLAYDYEPLLKFFEYTLINLGDPFVQSNCGIDSRKFEQEVLSFFSELYQLQQEDAWGYVTSGGTEGNLYGIFVGREVCPDGVLYFSRDTHYSIPKAARLCKIDSAVIDSQANGEMDYSHFERSLRANGSRSAIVTVNVGTTMKGAIDNLDLVLDILHRNQVEDYYIHCDGALSGMMLPFIANAPAINFTKPIGSIAISGHKFVGSPLPCGVTLTRKQFVEKVETNIEYIGSKDTTILGSRNGHAPLWLWYALKQRGREGMTQEVNACLKNARYLYNSLRLLNCPCLLNDFSTTVFFQKPPEHLVKKWQLATQGEWAHIVVMQNIDRHKVDEFIEDLRSTVSQVTSCDSLVMA